MKKNVKTSEIFSVYQIIGSAKYGKMEDADKIKAWKIARKLKPIATKFDEDSKDAFEKFKDGFEDFDKKAERANEYLRLKNEKKPTIDIMSDAEYHNLKATVFDKYNKLVSDAITEFGNKVVKIEFEPLSEEAFTKLMNSNDWTVGQVAVLGDFVCE